MLMDRNHAGFSCIPQDIPVMTATGAQAYPAYVETIHQKIKRLRLAAGLTQEQLAAEVGVKYQSVQEWEREGGTAPRRKHQAFVIKALKTTASELFRNEGEDVMAMRLTTKEELLVMHFRNMNENQQEEFLGKARDGGIAGLVTRKAAGSKKK